MSTPLTVDDNFERSRAAEDAQVIFGGNSNKESGYFIEPTVILTDDPGFRTMREEIFEPVLTAYVYEDDAFSETLNLCDLTSESVLTGSVFATDRTAIGQGMA